MDHFYGSCASPTSRPSFDANDLESLKFGLFYVCVITRVCMGCYIVSLEVLKQKEEAKDLCGGSLDMGGTKPLSNRELATKGMFTIRF